jgi:hypothetical protein
MEFGKLYFESQLDNKLKPMMHHAPKDEVKGREIVWAERSCFHKCARVIYRGFRLFYIAGIFYMLPFWIAILLFVSPGGDPAAEGGHH